MPTPAAQPPLPDAPLPDALIQALVDNAIDSAWVIGEDNAILYVNPAAQALTGWPRAQLVGASLDIILPDELHGVHGDIVRDFARGRRAGTVLGQVREFQIRHRSGNMIDVEIKAFELPAAGDGTRRYGAFISDICARKGLERELTRQATTDPLTGLLNRRSFFDQAADEVARARRYGRPLAVLMCDIDRFKAVNDRHGHGVGDEVLVAVSARCQAALRQSDRLARLGGEEFAVLLPESDITGARRTGERLRRLIAEQPCETSIGPLAVTVSIGCAILEGDDDGVDAVLARADAALYRAKRQGRNRVATAA